MEFASTQPFDYCSLLWSPPAQAKVPEHASQPHVLSTRRFDLLLSTYFLPPQKFRNWWYNFRDLGRQYQLQNAAGPQCSRQLEGILDKYTTSWFCWPWLPNESRHYWGPTLVDPKEDDKILGQKQGSISSRTRRTCNVTEKTVMWKLVIRKA